MGDSGSRQVLISPLKPLPRYQKFETYDFFQSISITERVVAKRFEWRTNIGNMCLFHWSSHGNNISHFEKSTFLVVEVIFWLSIYACGRTKSRICMGGVSISVHRKFLKSKNSNFFENLSEKHRSYPKIVLAVYIRWGGLTFLHPNFRKNWIFQDTFLV